MGRGGLGADATPDIRNWNSAMSGASIEEECDGGGVGVRLGDGTLKARWRLVVAAVSSLWGGPGLRGPRWS